MTQPIAPDGQTSEQIQCPPTPEAIELIHQLALSEKQQEQLQDFITLLLNKNKFLNLTAIRDPNDAWNRHITESLSFVPMIKKINPHRCVDLGTGGGIPGIPLAIALPQTTWKLIDARQKKIAFLNDVVTKLKLTNTQCIAERAELLTVRSSVHRFHYDLITARALAPMNKLIGLTFPFLQNGGFLFAIKGEKAEEELHDSQRTLALHRAEVVAVKRFPTATIVLIQKNC